MLPLDEAGRAVAARFQDRYTFEGFLGQGGFAAVYRVRNLRLDRVEALKVLFEARGSDPKFAARFEREARIAASLEHPNVVRVYDFGNADGTLWYSMQFVDGPTLKTRLERHGRLRGVDAAGLLVPLLEALEVVHRGGIVHRDVKPDNIILDGDERPYLMDFGIIKREDNVQETAEGKILGTPGYLSPEQLRGQPLDGRSDLYAAGVTLYQMITGDIPFRSDDRIATMTRRLTEDPEPPSAKARDIPPELERIVLKALARERDNRFATAAEMRAALEAFLAASGAAARSRSGAMPRIAAVPDGTGTIETTMAGTSVLYARDAGLSPAPAASPTSATAEPAHVAAQAPHPPRSSWTSAWRAGVVLALGALALAVFMRNRGPAATSPAPAPSSPATPVAAARATKPVPKSVSVQAATPARPATSVSSEAPVPRVPRVPANVLEEADVVVPPSLANTCGGKTVGVTIVVGADGSLKTSHVIVSAGPACDRAAQEAISHYRFRPARDEHDRPVEGRLAISIRY